MELTATLQLAKGFSSEEDLHFTITDPFPKEKQFQFRYGKYRLNESIKLDQIIDNSKKQENPQAYSNHQDLQNWHQKIHQFGLLHNSLNKDFDSLAALVRQNKNIRLFSGFAEEIDHLHEITLADLWYERDVNQMVSLRQKLKECQRLCDVYAAFKGVYLAQAFINANQAPPNANDEVRNKIKEKELQERAFVAWLGVDVNPNRVKNITESINGLANCIDNLLSLVSNLKSNSRFVCESPRFPLGIYRAKIKNDESGDESLRGGNGFDRLIEVNLPLVVEITVRK
jgi:hypothetical protein